MSSDQINYRLDGVYRQRQEGFLMQRVKLPTGVISSLQARAVARIAKTFGKETIHLTSRGSMEIHWIRETDLPEVKIELAKAGLTSRGACGGAVRGVTCGSQGAHGFPVLESMARQIHRHFTGNPRFERLPKKFKIGIEADMVGGRHLIQDVGLVLARIDNGKACYDAWIAGGLGRQPRPAFFLARELPEERIIPLIEAVLKVYIDHAPPPKRLKYLASELGEENLRRLIESEPLYSEELPPHDGLPENNVSANSLHQARLPVFAGQLTNEELAAIADISDRCARGILIVSSDQDILFPLDDNTSPDQAVTALKQAGFTVASPLDNLRFRICPGSHECLMGLAPVRDIAREAALAIPPDLLERVWSISGCPNSCTQPQLADIGIVTSRLTATEEGVKTPRFDIYRKTGTELGQTVRESLTGAELLEAIRLLQ